LCRHGDDHRLKIDATMRYDGALTAFSIPDVGSLTDLKGARVDVA